MITQKTFVYTSIQKEGYHSFPEAATNSEYATKDDMDVSHLANVHSHYFTIKVWIEVTHSNRQIEFLQLRRRLEQLYGTGALSLDSKSCEMIAEDLYVELNKWYPNVEIRIDVSEDNINGAYTEWIPEIS